NPPTRTNILRIHTNTPLCKSIKHPTFEDTHAIMNTIKGELPHILWDESCREYHSNALILILISRLQLIIPTAVLLLYFFNISFFIITTYWVTRFFNHSLFHRPTEVPLLLRAPIPNTTSPYWMTIHRILEALSPSPQTPFHILLYLSIVLFGPFIIPVNWIHFLFRWIIRVPLIHGVPVGVAIWFSREALYGLLILTIWLLQAIQYVLRLQWAQLRPRLWMFPVGFILLVMIKSASTEIVQSILDWIFFRIANSLYFTGDAIRDLMGVPFAMFEPGITVRTYIDSGTQTEWPYEII
ncbi:hypothetical protein B0T16DRAFT_515497, partial [Cercophora newfieldiana]